MIIEFSNAKEPKSHSTMAVAIVITACAFFFVPTTLIILGYYSSQPTGTLISPLPQGVLSQQPTPAPQTEPLVEAQIEQPIAKTVTPTIEPDNLPIIAADNTATEAAAADVAPKAGSNISDKTTTIEPGLTEKIVSDPDITEATQIYLSPRAQDKSLYSVRSKSTGEFTIAVSETSDILRYIDYHIVNP